MFHCTRVKDKGQNAAIIEILACLFVVGKIYAGILVDRVRKVTEGLIGDEQGGFRTGSGCVYQIFSLKQIGEKAREKKNVECMRVLWTWRRYMIGSIGRHYGKY